MLLKADIWDKYLKEEILNNWMNNDKKKIRLIIKDYYVFLINNKLMINYLLSTI